MAAATDGLGTDGGLNRMEGDVKDGTVGAVGTLPVVSSGVGAGVAAGVAAVVAAGLAVLPRPGLDGVPLGVKKKLPGGDEAPDTGLGDAAGGGEAAAVAAGLAGLTGVAGESVTTGVATGVATWVGRGPE